MPTIAATATPDPVGMALIVLTIVTVMLGYTVECWWYPFVGCRRCHGTGKLRSVFSDKTFRLCRRCNGTGRVLRPGRKVVKYLRALHDKCGR